MDHCQKVAIFGLGGIGKTQIALEYAYRTRKISSHCAIFWVPAISITSFEQAYFSIGNLLQIRGITEEEADTKLLVKEKLSEESSGEWLLVVNNADDTDILFKKTDDNIRSLPLVDFLPSSSKGSIIFTTRSRKAAVKQAKNNLIEVDEMNQNDARKIFERSLFQERLLNENGAILKLLELLTCLPLAISQAAAYINENDISISEYISIYEGSEEDIIEILSEEFEDRGRYREMKNPVATTWLISFNQIYQQDSLAIEFLSFMVCLVRENIPRLLFPPFASRKKEIDAIGTLTADSFITKQQSGQLFDIHRLVYLATRSWLRRKGQLSIWTEKALMRLAEVIPASCYKEQVARKLYLSHAIYVATSAELVGKEEVIRIQLLDDIGRYLQTNGRFKTAESMHQQALELAHNVYGKDLQQVLSHLAGALNNQGKHVKAEEIHRQILKLREEAHGIKHLLTLKSMRKLALVLGVRGKYNEAEQTCRQIVKVKENAFSQEQPSRRASIIT